MNLKIQVSTVLLSSQERFHVYTSSTILHCGGRGLQKQIGTARRAPYRNPMGDLPNSPLGFYGIFMDPIFRVFFVNPIPTRQSFWGQFWTESGDLKCETLRPALSRTWELQIPRLIILIKIARGIHGSNPVLAGKWPDDIPYGGHQNFRLPAKRPTITVYCW